jgi:hypothetical protein
MTVETNKITIMLEEATEVEDKKSINSSILYRNRSRSRSRGRKRKQKTRTGKLQQLRS